MSIGLSVYLFEASVRDFSDGIAPNEEWSEADLLDGFDVPAQIWVRFNAESEPDLVGRLQGLVSLEGLSSNRQSSAVLLLRIRERIAAVCFGHGRYLLDKLRLVPNFGLVVASRVDEDDVVKQASARSNGVRIHASSASPVHIRTLIPLHYHQLQMIEPVRTSIFPMKVEGRRALRFQKRGHITELLPYIEQAVELYLEASDVHFAHFPAQPIPVPRNSEVWNLCNRELVARLAEGRVDDTATLELPWEMTERGVQSTRLSQSGTSVPLNEEAWIDLNSLLSSMPIEVSEESLTTTQIVIEENGSQLFRILLLAFIDANVTVNGEDYFLSEGSWLKLPETLRCSSNHAILDMEQTGSDLVLPAWAPGVHEKEYNEQTAGELALLNLDRDLWLKDGNSDRFEISDLVNMSGDLIHVKRCNNKEATVVLTSQAITSMRSLFERIDVRQELAAREAEYFEAVPKAEQRRIVLAMQLPMNKESVRQLSIGQRLAVASFAGAACSMGYRPALSYIPHSVSVETVSEALKNPVIEHQPAA